MTTSIAERAPSRNEAMRAPSRDELLIFTIVSANYIAYAATLMQSVRRHHKRARRVIVLADRPASFDSLDLAADLIGCEVLGIEWLENMALWYSVIEFNTAIKPYAFRYFLDAGADRVCYLDPDIFVYRPLSHVLRGLRTHEAVLTPHLLEPMRDRREPSDHSIMKSGVYNLGFFAVRDTPSVRRLLDWWAERNLAHCRVDIAGNMFTDQRWMDMAPCFLSAPLILRHPGYNVAYWNLAARPLSHTEDGWFAGDEPLAFFHFSGIDPDDRQVVSKHQNRFAIDDIGAAAQLFDDYRARVLANGWRRFSDRRYGFAAFADGRPVEPTMRRWLLRAIDEGMIVKTDRLALASDFFDAIDPADAARGVSLSRFLVQFRLDRDDLRFRFDLQAPEQQEHYANWFVGHANEQGVSGHTVTAAARARGAADDDAAPNGEPLPWPSLAQNCWRGAAADADRYLRGDVLAGADEFLLPRQLALLWERRRDLQRQFHLRNPASFHDYLAWGLSQGVAEKSLDPDLLSADFIDHFAAVSDISGHYGDVPITRGLVIAQHMRHRAPLLEARSRFPQEAKGRLAHGLWFAYVAPRRFGWPVAMVMPVRRYFQRPSNVAFEGFQLTRGALAIWELHASLQASFPLTDAMSCFRFLRWLVFDGLAQVGVDLDDFDPRLRYFLAHRSARVPRLSRLAEMAHGLRADLQERFDIRSDNGCRALLNWIARSICELYPHLAVGSGEPAATATETATIGLAGLWHSTSGRGEDVRCSAAALEAAGFHDYRIIDLASGDILRPDGSRSTASRLRVRINIVHTNADTAVETWNALRRFGVAADRTIGYWAWELASLPRSWRHAFSFYDEIWAATRFACRAFRRAGERKVRLVPMAVVATPAAPSARARQGVAADRTMFVFAFDYRSYLARKNPMAVIAAFRRAFPLGDETVDLVIKTLGSDSAQAACRLVLQAVASDRRIRLIDATLSRAEMLGLIAAADGFVSLHRSEGFGRGPAEAMLLGVPTIVTGYSGTCDFATEGYALPVAHRLIPVLDSEYPGVDGQFWADPDIDAAARHLRFVHEEPDAASALGAKGRARIGQLYHPARIGGRMLAVLGVARAVGQVEQAVLF